MSKKQRPIPRAVRLPGWFLRARGGVDARLRGHTAAEAYIDRICHREAALEADEVMTVEAALGALRENAAQCLAQRKTFHARLEEPLPSQSDDSDQIRVGRRDTEERSAARRGLDSCQKDILAANEELAHTHAQLSQRLAKLRSQTEESISFYIMGVRSSRGLKDFTCAGPKFPASMERYLSHHETLDSEIRRIAEQMIKEATAA